MKKPFTGAQVHMRGLLACAVIAIAGSEFARECDAAFYPFRSAGIDRYHFAGEYADPQNFFSTVSSWRSSGVKRLSADSVVGEGESQCYPGTSS